MFLSGTLPVAWSSLTSLIGLTLAHTAIKGTLPYQWSTLTTLTTFYIGSNKLTGIANPCMACSPCDTTSLNVDIPGTLPEAYSTWINIRNLLVGQNSFAPRKWDSVWNE